MASASSSYDSVLRASTAQQKPPARPAKRKRPAATTRVKEAPATDIYLVSPQSGPNKHTYLSFQPGSVEAVQPNTYVARLIRNVELPDHDLIVDTSHIAGNGVFTPEHKTFLKKEALSSYTREAKFAYRLKHRDWADDRKMSCFLAFVIDDDNKVQPVSQYEYILWTHVRVKWNQNTDLQLGILPADRPIRMINHQKSEANVELVTLVNPDICCGMVQEGDEETNLVPVVDARELVKRPDSDTPLPVQVIFQARQKIGPVSQELCFDYFEGDEDQEEFDPDYELVWIFWNNTMRRKVKNLTGLLISSEYAPPYCKSAPTQPPNTEMVSLHNKFQISYRKACEGEKENLKEFIRSFAKKWRYCHPDMPFLLVDEFEKKDAWSKKEFCFIKDFYRKLFTMLNGKVPVPGQQHKKWSIKTLGAYLVESNLFDRATSDRLIHPDWLQHLSRSQPEKYEIYLKRYIRQQLADDKNINPLARLLRFSDLRTCYTHKEFTPQTLTDFINRHDLDSSEDVGVLASRMGADPTASSKVKRLINNGNIEAAKALVREFILKRHYSLQQMISDGPLKKLSITGDSEEGYTTIPQLIQFINTHMAKEASNLIKDPLLISPPDGNISHDGSISDHRLKEIWGAVTTATTDAGDKTRNEYLKTQIMAENPESMIWLECHIRDCFLRVKERETARFSSSVTDSLNIKCPLSSISLYMRQHIPELKEAVSNKQEKWDRPLLLTVCARLGINNLILQNGQLLAIHIAVEMGLPIEIKMTDTHATLLHPQKAIGASEELSQSSSQNTLGIGELVEQEINDNYEKYSQNITSQLASLWYTRPLDEMIKNQVMFYTGRAGAFLNSKVIYPPYGGDLWTKREIAEYLLRHGLTEDHIQRKKPQKDQRPFAVYIAENLPFCWQPPFPKSDKQDKLDLSIPKGLEETVKNLREDVNNKIRKCPKTYTDTTLRSLARAGFASASNEMIKRLHSSPLPNGRGIVSSLKKFGLSVYSRNQWHQPSYPAVLEAMKEHKLLSEKAIARFEQKFIKKNLLDNSDQKATPSPSAQPDMESDNEYDTDDSEAHTPPPKKRRLSPQPE